MNLFVMRSTIDNTSAKRIARQLQSPYKIYNFVKDNVKYVTDSRWQSWRTPDETIKALRGDCVDKTLLAKSMLDELGIKNRMIIKYTDGKKPEAHIYNQVMMNGYWTDYDGSCTTCTIGRSFAYKWKTVAIIYDTDTVIFDNALYNIMME